jgi:hypothetical protein
VARGLRSTGSDEGMRMDVVSRPEEKEVDRNICLISNGKNNKNVITKLQFLKSMSLQNAHQPEGAKERRSGDARAADTDTPASLQTGLRDPAEENSGGTELVTSHMDIEASSEEMDRTASGGPLREIPSADRGRSMRGKEGATSHTDKDSRSEDRTASDGPLSEIPSADRGRSVRGKEVATSRTDKEASSEEMDPSTRYPLWTGGDR